MSEKLLWISVFSCASEPKYEGEFIDFLEYSSNLDPPKPKKTVLTIKSLVKFLKEIYEGDDPKYSKQKGGLLETIRSIPFEAYFQGESIQFGTNLFDLKTTSSNPIRIC
jgi:hypothetical protein